MTRLLVPGSQSLLVNIQKTSKPRKYVSVRVSNEMFAYEHVDQLNALTNRMDRLEEAVGKYVDARGKEALKKSVVPGLDTRKDSSDGGGNGNGNGGGNGSGRGQTSR